MFTHPAITAALADQHRRDLTAQASASQIARAARDARPARPGRSRQPRRITSPVQVIKRAVAAALTSFVGRAEEVREVAALLAEYRAMAAAVLVMTPAGAATTPHVSAHHFVVHSGHCRWA